MFANRKQKTNREMAAMLFNIATILRDREDNPYRVRAYLNAARRLMWRGSEDIAASLRDTDKTLPHPRGVLGDRVQRRLRDLARTGQMPYFDELCADLPAWMVALMSVPGVGPAHRAQYLYDTLGIETPEQLLDAARAGRLEQVWGIGAKRQEQWAQLSLFEDGDFLPQRLAA